MAENATDGILIATGKGDYIYANKGAARITGYSVTELLDLIQTALGNWAVRVRIPGPVLMGIASVAEWVGRVTGSAPSLNRTRARDFLEEDWACSVVKAESVLDYRASVTFPEGAQKTVAWYLEKGWL